MRLWPLGWKNWLQMVCNQLQYHPVLVHPQTDTARDAGTTCQKYAWSPTESAEFLLRHGKAIARDGDFPGAVTQFKRALKLDDSLDLDPEAEASALAVPALIAQGEELPREAQVEEARAKFQQAVKLDDSLSLYLPRCDFNPPLLSCGIIHLLSLNLIVTRVSEYRPNSR